MRLAVLVLALTLALAAPARAQEPAAADPAAAGAPSEAAAVAAPPESPAPAPPADAVPPEDASPAEPFARWGLLVDAGFPEGGTVSVVFRPVEQIRLSAGPAWSVIAFGVQGGITLVPWHLGLSPILSAEVGRFFAADASFLARDSSGVPDDLEPLLRDVGYDYAAAHVGLELGSRDGFAFSLRAGVAYVSVAAKGRATVTEGGDGSTVTFVDPKVLGTFPSVKLGFQLWF